VVGIAVVFSLARFSEAFLILRAQAVGLPVMLVPMVLVLMNVVYALAAYPAGVLSDHANRTTILGMGFGLLVAADLVFAFTKGLAGVATGVALWGLHMGFTQGLLATLVADTAPPELRGTAYGIFNLLCGLATLVASVLAGALWDSVGPQSTFLGGAALTAIALAGLAATRQVAPIVGQGAKSD
jgi:MFS family permease